MRRTHIVPLLMTCLLSAANPALCAPRVLWSVGQTDRSGREFGVFGHYAEFPRAFPSGTAFTAGKDSAAAWPYIHPGPADAWAGGRPHTLRIGFTLEGTPAGEYAVVIDTVSAHSGVPPTLEVSLNGASESFRLPPGPGDVALDDERSGAPATIRAVFPPDVLHQGRNELALTTTRGSWFLYDAVHLENDPERAFEPLSGVLLEPTALFARLGGRLEQVVILAATCYYPGAAGTATIRWEGGESVQPVEFRPGECRIPLRVPEAAKAMPMQVALDAGGKRISLETVVTPQRKWIIYVDPTVHTDIGYTDRQAAVRRLQVNNIEAVLRRMREDPSFHWNLEIMWHARIFLADRPAMRSEFLQRLRDGRIGLHAGPFNMLTELMSDEEMNRYAYDAEALRRQTGVSTPIATLTDVPSASWALPSALAASGVRYLAIGANQGRPDSIARNGIRVPFWWEGPDGRRVLTWINDAYGRADWLRGDATLESIERAVTGIVKGQDRPDYPFDAVYVFGALMDNSGFDQGFGAQVTAWNAAWAYPRVVVGRGDEFFRHIEARNPAVLKTIRGDLGSWWEDGAGSSAAETALTRASQQRITQAETLWSMAGIAGSLARYPVARFDAAWDNIVLYDEHTWGAAQSISAPDSAQTRDQWKVKAAFAHTAARAAEALRSDGLSALVRRVPARRGDVVVANTLPRARAGMTALPRLLLPGQILLDAKGRRAQVQRSGGKDYVWADAVPGMGTAVYHVARIRANAPVSPVGRASPGTLESRYYRIRLDARKGIVSIIDRVAGRELADATGRYGFGEVVYVAGGEATAVENNGMPAPLVVANTAGDGMLAASGTLRVTRARVTGISPGDDGPLYSEVVIWSQAPSLPVIETRVRLYHRQRRIELFVKMRKEEVRRKEAVYVAFPFRVKEPKVTLGLTNASARPDRDFVPGACFEWFSVQHGVRLTDREGRTIEWGTPDAPLVTLGDIDRGEWLTRQRPAAGLLFSWVMNNYWGTNYQAGQGGTFSFRYVIGTSPVDADRLGYETAAPLCAALSPGVSAPPLPRIGVSGSGVAVTTLKAAQDGDGYVLRLRNTSAEPARARVSMPGPGWRARVADLVERPLGQLAFRLGACSVALRPRETVTVRLSRTPRL